LFLYMLSNLPARSVIYTLSLHDALPIFRNAFAGVAVSRAPGCPRRGGTGFRCYSDALKIGAKGCSEASSSGRSHEDPIFNASLRSEEHTSELQSRGHLVCRLLLEKKQPT